MLDDESSGDSVVFVHPGLGLGTRNDALQIRIDGSRGVLPPRARVFLSLALGSTLLFFARALLPLLLAHALLDGRSTAPAHRSSPRPAGTCVAATRIVIGV